MNARLTMRSDAVASTAENRRLSLVLESRLMNLAPDDAVARCILLGMCLPIGKSSWEIIAKSAPEELAGEWIRMPMLTWNPWQNESLDSLVQMLEVISSPLQLRSFLRKLSALLDPAGKRCPLRFLGSIIESTLPERFPMLLISSSNGSCSVAKASAVSVEMPAGGVTPKVAKVRRRTKKFAIFDAVTKAIRAQVDQLNPEFALPIRVKGRHRAEALTLDALYNYWESESKGLTPGSHLRKLSELPWIAQIALSGDVPDAVTDLQRSAILLFSRFGDAQLAKPLLDLPTKDTITDTILVSLDGVRTAFGLNDPYPNITDERACAFRVCLILLSLGRRCSCLYDIQLGHFIDSGEAFDVCIPTTKVTAQDNFWLPLLPLLGDSDLAFLREWVPDVRSRLPATMRLLEAAGLKPGTKKNMTQAFARRLARVKNSSDLRLHDLRRTAATWFPVRCELAFHPNLRSHPLLARMCKGDSFSDEALARLRNLPIHEGDDRLKVLAALLGHSTRWRARLTYIRSWPILSALYGIIARERVLFDTASAG